MSLPLVPPVPGPYPDPGGLTTECSLRGGRSLCEYSTNKLIKLDPGKKKNFVPKYKTAKADLIGYI